MRASDVHAENVPLIDPLADPEVTYLQVANHLAGRIKTGEFDHKLPAEEHLAKDYGVSYQTQRHAMKILRDRGLILTRQGRGTFVAKPHSPHVVPE